MESRKSEDEYEMMDIPLSSPNISQKSKVEAEVVLEVFNESPRCFVIFKQYDAHWIFLHEHGQIYIENTVIKELMIGKNNFDIQEKQVDVLPMINLQNLIADDSESEDIVDHLEKRFVVEFNLTMDDLTKLLSTNIISTWHNVKIKSKRKEEKLIDDIREHIVGIYCDVFVEDQHNGGNWYRDQVFDLTKNTYCMPNTCHIL